ncbi:MAG: arylsulfatase [Rubripirellula sp.]|nr:arylsulfatase [Rubripirellula sp.]
MILSRWLGIALVTILTVNDGYSQRATKPNVVVILTDDQGWGDLSLHGNPNLSTPNIDAMARDGAEVEHFYVCAVCSPTRAEFLTGRYHPRMGVHSTSTGGERFNADEQTIAEVFRDAGYATAAYGKWHSGMQYPYHPNARGFEDFYGFCSGHWGNYFSPMLEHNGRLVQGDGFLVDDLTTHAIEFIDKHRDQPFFVYLPLNTPHSPMQVPDFYWDKFENKTIVPDPAPENQKRQNLTHTRAALAMCENIDANVGRLIDHLEEIKIADNTIVVYFCDNGPNGSRFNGGLRGRKGSTHEGGLRSPCLIRYPRKVQGGTKINQIAAAIDLLPTLADFAGIESTPTKPLDGLSIAPLLRGEQSDWSDRKIFSAWNNKVTVRTDQFRKQVGGPLYDVESDPRERTDIAKEKPKVAARLEKALQQWIAETQPRSSRDPETRPFNLGHPDAIFTQLPARDATPHGKIVRSNRYPNCTFMTEWTNTDDQITWDLEVLSKGKYEVEMYYACPDSSVGTVLELSLGDETIQATIEQANESPLSGMQDDRFKRAEGYVKDWKPMKLGVIKLQPGPATLTLRASKMTGTEVGDMRLLLFRKLP